MIQFFPCNTLTAMPCNPQLSGNGIGGIHMIPGDHYCRYTCTAENLHHFLRLRSGRITHPHDSQECHTFFPTPGSVSALCCRQCPKRQGIHEFYNLTDPFSLSGCHWHTSSVL